jgi:hypothetical protein
MHRSLKSLFVLLAVCGSVLACASAQSTRPAAIAQPGVQSRLTHPLFFGSGSTSAANIEVTIRNRANVPITVRRIEIDSPGMAMYGIRKTIREFRETIPAGGEKALIVFATAVTTTDRPTEPLSLRTIVELEAGDAAWREIVMDRRVGN